jgi:hypothetical protein
VGRGEMIDKNELPTVDVKVVRETLAGYAVAAEYIERERIEQLRQMTPQESWEIFLGLLESGRRLIGKNDDLQLFDRQQLESMLYVRKVFKKAAQAQGLL